MKKVLSFTLIVCIMIMSLCGAGYAEAAISPLMTVETGYVGDTISVIIDIPADTHAAGGSFNLVYDSEKMELVDAVAGEILGGFTTTINKTYAENKLRLNFAGVNEISANGGTLLNATFKLLSAGTAEISTEKFKLADTDANYLTCENVSYILDIEENVETEAVTGVALDTDYLELAPGDHYEFVATLYPEGAEASTIDWYIDADEDVLMGVQSIGRNQTTFDVYAQNPGSAVVTVSVDGKHYASCDVVVKDAYGNVSGGNCGDSLQWKIENKVLVITGSGEMYDYSSEEDYTLNPPPWFPYRESITDIILPEGLTRIGDFGLVGCTRLNTILLPSTLVSIGERAFMDWISLEEIELPESVTTIEDGAFEWNDNFKKITIYEGVNEFGEGVFEMCNNLTIYGVAGSAANIYANENEIPFVAFDIGGGDGGDDDEEETVFAPMINAEPGKVGDIVSVIIDIPADTHAAGGSFNLVYDNEKMELVDATAGEILSGFTTTINKTYAENKVRLNFAGVSEISANGGTLLTATFKLISAGTAEIYTEKFKLADIDTNYLTCENSTLYMDIGEGEEEEETVFAPMLTAETGKVGDTVTVIIDIPADTHAAGGSFNLVYDNTKMELIDAVAGEILTGFTTTINKTYAENKVRLNFAGVSEISANGGTLLTATFKLISAGTAEIYTEKFKLADIDTNYLTCENATVYMDIEEDEVVFAPMITAETGKVGDTISVSVAIPQDTHAAGGSFNLVYDNEKMELVDATAGEILGGFTTTINKTYAENKIRLNFAGVSEISANGGTLLTATFKLISAGSAEISTEKFKLADVDTNYLTCENATVYMDIEENEEVDGVTGVTLNTNYLELKVGDEYEFVATILPEGAEYESIVWDAEGQNSIISFVQDLIHKNRDTLIISALKPGTAVVTVTVDGKYSASCTVVVTEATEAPEITVSQGKTMPGKNVDVTVDLTKNTGFANLGIELGYDSSVLRLIDVKANAAVGATFTPAQSYDANPFNMSWDSALNVYYNGSLVTLTFAVSEDAPDGTYPITLDYYKGVGGYYVDGENVNYDENFKPMGFKYNSGCVTVASHIPGDINGDETVDNKDATYLLRYLAGWTLSDIVEEALDVDGSGVIDNRDATILLRYLAGWDVTLR